ncbi:hypothetical protein FOZ62_026216, partial [Perkinsus olseni]
RCELCDTSDRNDGGARWNLKELAVPVLEASLSQHAKTVGHVWALSQKEGALRKCKEKDEPSCPIKYDIQNSDFFQFKQFLGRGRPTEIPAEFFEINTAFYSYACRICQPSSTSSLSGTHLTPRRASTLASLQPPSHAPASPSPPLAVNDRPVADAAVISTTQTTAGNDRL